MTGRITVDEPTSADFAQWRALYQGDADFYGVEQTDEMAQRVWSWVTDPDHEVGPCPWILDTGCV